MSAFWTDAEMEALRRNYPRHGTRTKYWDEPIDRSERSICAQASRIGVAYGTAYGTSLDDSDRARLRYVATELCGKLNVSMRELAHEIALIANRESL